MKYLTLSAFLLCSCVVETRPDGTTVHRPDTATWATVATIAAMEYARQKGVPETEVPDFRVIPEK